MNSKYMEKEEPPDLVKGTYTTDLNINKINDAIISRFKYFTSLIPEYEKNLNILNNVLETEHKTLNEIRAIKEDIQILSDKIQDYKNNISLNVYKQASEKLLENYNRVASDKSKGVIIFKQVKNVESKELINYRLKIISDYLEIAKKYINLEITRKVNIRATCGGCNIDLSNIFIDEDSGFYNCSNCGFEKEILSHNITYRDTQHNNNNSKNNYDDCDNFRKALARFQGKQSHRPPNKLYEQLDEYFTRINKPIGEEIIKLPLLSDGRKKGTSRQMMFEALSETSNSAYYDDINLILHTYWGWSLPDISQLEEKIMDDYIATQKVYNSIPDKDRDASLNIQFRLFVHLKAIDYPCNKDDFKIQTSRDSLIFHNEMWKIMCEKTNVKYFAVI